MESSQLQLVDCARVKLRLTESACVRFWFSANPVQPPAWQGRNACYSCSAGAARAGVTLNQMQAARDGLSHVCGRCLRTSSRMVRGTLCVSCYNREREVARGRNAKGRPPVQVAARLFPCRLVVLDGGSGVERIEASFAAGVLELALNRARRATKPLSFGWAPPEKEAA